MRIHAATVNGFRNLVEDSFAFSPQVNLLLAGNGEGKTNLLEALNFFALGRSHRGGRSDELIAFDAQALHVQLEVEEDAGEVAICEFGLDRTGGRRLRIDGEEIKRRADLLGRLVTVFFDPDSISLVRGAPQGRRQFVDQGMAEIDPLYLPHLTAFQRALRQKTGLLRDLKRDPAIVPRTRRELTAWNRELAIHAAGVCRGRAAYAKFLQPFLLDRHNALSDNKLETSFIYRPRLESAKRAVAADATETGEKGRLEADIFDEIDYIKESEIRRGRPLIGPQQDDFSVRLGEVDLRIYGSQGETRTAAIAMILARSDVLFEQRRIRPVLFLDDIFSELDRDRTRRLQEMAMRDHQVFIATARRDDVTGWSPDGMKTWTVQAGKFTPAIADTI